MLEREIRDMEIIQRWTIVRSHRQQNLAAHSCMVAIYADQIATYFMWQGDRAALMRYALWHDIEETFTGDIPGPWKRRLGDAHKKEVVQQLFVQFPGEEWLPPNKDNIDKIVKVANCLDEVFWVAIEDKMGNPLNELFKQARGRLETAIGQLPFIQADIETFRVCTYRAIDKHRYLETGHLKEEKRT